MPPFRGNGREGWVEGRREGEGGMVRKGRVKTSWQRGRDRWGGGWEKGREGAGEINRMRQIQLVHLWHEFTKKEEERR